MVKGLCGKATNKGIVLFFLPLKFKLRVETGNTQPQYFDHMKNSSDFLNEKIKKKKGNSAFEYH